MKNPAKRLFRIFTLLKPHLLSYILVIAVFCLTETIFRITIGISVKIIFNSAINSDLKKMLSGILIMSIVSVTGGFLFVIFMYHFMVGMSRHTNSIQKRLFLHSSGLSAGYHDRNHSGDLVSRINNDVRTMQTAYGWPFWDAACVILSGTVAAFIMIIFEWRVSLVLLGMSLVFILVNSRISAVLGKISAEVQKATGRLTEMMSTLITGFTAVRNFNIEDRILGKFEDENKHIFVRSRKRILISALQESYNVIIYCIGTLGVLGMGAVLAGKGILEFGTIFALIYLTNYTNWMLNSSGRIISTFQNAFAGGDRVFEILDEPTEPECTIISGKIKNMIEIKDLSFSYDGKSTVLDKLNLSVRENQTAALVGPSGGGKSTVLKLLMGFYPVSNGSITLKNDTRDKLSLDELREMISIVPQESFLFDDTIKHNICFGNPSVNEQEIIKAAQAANIHEFIMSLENGYSTVVGERGTRLSGGQKQRIAIARAILRDTPILLLDEATSSLDSAIEKLIQKAIERISENRTVIIVAHRLSTILNADIIYMIENGKVTDKGSHNELIKKSGPYKKLYKKQFMKTNPVK